MSILLQAHTLGYSAGTRVLFQDLDLAVSSGDRLGLVGHNGCGKTTLLDLLAKAIEPDVGHITHARGLRFARVEQFLPIKIQRTDMLSAAAESCAVDEQWRAAAELSSLGFSEAQHLQPVESLSGGQLNRLMLARALVQQPDLLLLDEPSNHLDIATLRMFEDVLVDYRGAFLLVSHDRAFLDRLARTTIVLRDKRSYRFELPYSQARTELARMDTAAAARRGAQEKKINQLKTSAKRMADWGRTYDNEDLARRAKSMFRRVDRLESERTFVTAGSPLDLELAVGSSRGDRIVTLENFSVEVPGRRLFHIDEVFLRPGERVVLLGNNGTGKTTLIRALVNTFAQQKDGATDAQIRFSPQAQLGYYDQELQQASTDLSLFDFVARDIAREDQAIVQTLVAAGFAFAAHTTPISVLSGGERARALFVRLSLARPNFLILDEPTNHIDIEGREQLEAQLLASTAAVLFTSHDRTFVQALAQRFLIIEDGKLREYQDADKFFTGALNSKEQVEPKEQAQIPSSRETSDEDALLERIEELEAKLAADVARKPKFQKPQLQLQWRTELAELYERLD